MRVVWSELAAYALQDTAAYLFEEFGLRQQDDFLTQIEHLTELISVNPLMGKTEPLLADLPHAFRSIVANPYNKIVYVVNGDDIDIVDFWDTRRDPAALIARLS